MSHRGAYDPMPLAQSVASFGAQAAQALDCPLLECYEHQEAGCECKDDSVVRVVCTPESNYSHAPFDLAARDDEHRACDGASEALQADAGTAAAQPRAAGGGSEAPEVQPRPSPQFDTWAGKTPRRSALASAADSEVVDAAVRWARSALHAQAESPLSGRASATMGVVDERPQGVGRLHAATATVPVEGRVDWKNSPMLSASSVFGRTDAQRGSDGTSEGVSVQGTTPGRQIVAAKSIGDGALRKDVSPHDPQASREACPNQRPRGVSESQAERRVQVQPRYCRSTDDGTQAPEATESFAVLDSSFVSGEPPGIDLAWIVDTLSHAFRIKPKHIVGASQLFRRWTIPPRVAIVEQGMPVSSGPALSILFDGIVDVFVRPAGGVHSEHVLTYDRPGHCFGNVELLLPALASSPQRRRHWATMATRTPVILWAVQRDVLQKFIREIERDEDTLLVGVRSKSTSQ